MQLRTRAVMAAAGIVAALAAGTSVAVARGGGDDQESPIPAAALERASAVALAHTGGGAVTDTEVGDEDSYYEVEVTLDGKEIDVQLDADFNVVGAEPEGADDEGTDDEGTES